MRRFAVCFSSLGIFAASISSGCSSDNASPGDSGTDVNTTAMDSSTVDSPAESSPIEAGKEAAACVPVDASVETIAAGSQWACYQSACSSQLTACAADCRCNRTILTSLGCSAAGGDPTMCFGTAIVSSGAESMVVAALACLQMKMGMCGGATEGGAEAGAETGAEGGATEGGVDGGVDGGATDGGGVDGGADGAVTDAPTAG